MALVGAVQTFSVTTLRLLLPPWCCVEPIYGSHLSRFRGPIGVHSVDGHRLHQASGHRVVTLQIL